MVVFSMASFHLSTQATVGNLYFPDEHPGYFFRSVSHGNYFAGGFLWRYNKSVDEPQVRGEVANKWHTAV